MVIEPDAAALQALARAYGVAGIAALKADLTLKPWGKEGVRVTGPLTAVLKQTCVVSLEPFEQALEDEIDRTFVPAQKRPRRARDLNTDGEIEIDLETMDPPDIMENGLIDLGAVICEQLALNIDPFPRKPGANFHADDADTQDEDAPAPSPFAALAGMKLRTDH